MKKYYKILLVEDDKLLSAIKNFYSVQYFPCEKTLPWLNGSRLFAFTNFNTADYFFKTNLGDSKWAIYECEVEDPQPIERVSLYAGKDSTELFWQLGSGVVHTMKAPEGAVACKSITILREVQSDNV